MKTIIILFMTAVTSTSANAQTGKASLEQTINQFVNAMGDRDVHAMHYLLHEKFQSIEKSSVLSKSDYMKMLGERKLGGTELRSQIILVDLGESSASVKVRISGRFEWAELYVHLYKNDLGAWQVLHVLPYIHDKV
jgi:hypothetical protein